VLYFFQIYIVFFFFRLVLKDVENCIDIKHRLIIMKSEIHTTCRREETKKKTEIIIIKYNFKIIRIYCYYILRFSFCVSCLLIQCIQTGWTWLVRASVTTWSSDYHYWLLTQRLWVQIPGRKSFFPLKPKIFETK
jgi:hypothetical protein